MADFNPSDLKAWRKAHKLSQEKFAKLSKLGLSTVMSIEAGIHKMQDRTLIKLQQAIAEIEAGMTPSAAAKSAAPVAVKPKVETKAAVNTTAIAASSESSADVFPIQELRTWRKKYGLTQAQFAELAGLSGNTIANIEVGSHNVHGNTLAKITSAVRATEAKTAPKVEKVTPPTPVVVKPAPAPVIEVKPVKPVAPVVSAPVHTPAPAPVTAPVVTVQHPAIRPLDNIDIELIVRLLGLPSGKKIEVLKGLMEE